MDAPASSVATTRIFFQRLIDSVIKNTRCAQRTILIESEQMIECLPVFRTEGIRNHSPPYRPARNAHYSANWSVLGNGQRCRGPDQWVARSFARRRDGSLYHSFSCLPHYRPFSRRPNIAGISGITGPTPKNLTDRYINSGPCRVSLSSCTRCCVPVGSPLPYIPYACRKNQISWVRPPRP